VRVIRTGALKKESNMSNDTTILTETMNEAIVFCAEKTKLQGRDQVAAARARADCSACEYLRYGLAKGVAEYLGSLDGTIKAIYIFDPDTAANTDGHIPDQPRLSPGISMLIWVSHKTAALASLLTSVSQAADEEFWRLPCPEANALCYMLDPIVVDDQEVQERRGYGAVVDSIYMSPTELWHRDPVRLTSSPLPAE
jgi:hypothetical protein